MDAETLTESTSYIDFWNYPKPPRREQEKILDFASKSRSNTLIVHAPTGVGKSGICAAIANSDTGAILTPHKLLQDQYCVGLNTRVLFGDLRYRPAFKVSVGDTLLGFDEHRVGVRRHWRPSIVERVELIVRPSYKLIFEDGTEIISSEDHQWLTGPKQVTKWATTSSLRACSGKPATSVVKLLDVWEDDFSFEAGYLAAAFEGEGHLCQRPPARGNGWDVNLSFAQKPNVMLERVMGCLDTIGIKYTLPDDWRERLGDCIRLGVSYREDQLRFLGQVRPERLLQKLDLNGLGMIRTMKGLKLRKKEFLGDTEVVAIKTTTSTFIAEGLASHNCRDWPTAALIKGKQNYPCSSARMKQSGTRYTAMGTSCKAGSGWCRDSECPYKCAKSAFVGSQMGVSNYNWLLSSLKGSTEVPHNWLLFDEGHELEPKLIESATIELTDEFCYKHHINFELFDDGDDAKDWLLNKVSPALSKAYDLLAARIEGGEGSDPKVALDASELEEVLGSIGFYDQMESEETWVYSTNKDNTKCSFKPLFASGLFSRFIEPLNKRHLITSATLSPGKLIKKWLGLSSFDEMAVSSPFPVGNRQVFFKSVVKLNKDNLQEMMPKMVKFIDAALDTYKGEKGIIHCHSFALAETIFRLSNHKERLLKHDADNSREQLLETHINSKFPTVLLSPSMTEGIDLADDLSRFTIFPKMPFPYLGDKWVMARKNEDPDWYDWQIAKTIMQGVGRSVRHAKDYADAYILDGNFYPFFERCSHLFPRWFRDSIVMP